MRTFRSILVVALPLAAAFCLYGAFHFLTIEDISSPEQLPRMRYNRNCWFVFVLAAAALWLVVRRWRPGTRP